MTKRLNLLLPKTTAALFSLALCGGAVQPATAQTTSAQIAPAPTATAPQLRFQNRLVQGTLGKAYNGALDNLLRVNTVPDTKNEFNKAGLMKPGDLFIRAGGAYNTPWTRDASINAWNAASLLEPSVARNTLWAVAQKQPDGSVVLQRDDQWWDKVIWISSAWNHYKVTGDRTFLATAYEVTQDELALMRREHFNATYGLFSGPAVFADGIAGYPEPIYDSKIGSGFVLDHPLSKDIMALSTNAIYYGAHRNAALMARELGRPATEIKAFNNAADALKTAINRHLWMPEKGNYAYFVHGTGPKAGQRDETQEGIGISFAILMEVADAKQTQSLLRTTHRTPHGIATQWPHFPRYSDEKPGRHNVMIWPLVSGMWASAAAKAGDLNTLRDETENLALLALDHGQGRGFYEIYNSQTGQPDGGWQNHHWGPLADQTWSATAYLRMMYNGVFGMDFQTGGLSLAPKLPANWGDVSLQGVKYRNMTLDISLQGKGARVAQVMIDGKVAKTAFIPATLTGRHTVAIALKE